MHYLEIPSIYFALRAQSGTGKTATFSISVLQKVDIQLREVQTLVLSPTRELATQIQKVRGGGGEINKMRLRQESLCICNLMPQAKFNFLKCFTQCRHLHKPTTHVYRPHLLIPFVVLIFFSFIYLFIYLFIIVIILILFRWFLLSVTT